MEGRQLFPPFEVIYAWPPEVVTVASRELFAEMAVKSSLTGGLIFRHFLASLVSRIKPPRPASQQVRLSGAEPDKMEWVWSTVCVAQLVPPSSDRSMDPPPAIRHMIFGSGVGIIIVKRL